MFNQKGKFKSTAVEAIFLLLILILVVIGVSSILMSKKGAKEPIELPDQEEAIIQKKKIPSSLLVDNFEKGETSGVFSERINSIGGYQGTWAKRPSYALIKKSALHRRGGKGLAIEFDKKGGWCGWYTLLNGADVSGYNTLSFWIKGAKGKEQFDVGLTDKRMQELEMDSAFVGAVNSFLPQGEVTTGWQEAKVPLSRLANELDFTSMGALTFWFKYEGSGTIYVDDVTFTNDPEVQKTEEYNLPQASFDAKHPRSMWVWKIDPINNLKARKELFEFCQRAAVTTLYLYFGEFSQETEPEYAERLAQFLKESHGRRLTVEALTGNPSWALPGGHTEALSWIRGFLEFNKKRPAQLRMDGVSLDVEPYLTSNWLVDREGTKREYLELLAKCRALINGYGQNFRFGVAIPVGFNLEGEEFEREVLQQVDYVALMDYFDNAHKIIEEAAFHLNLADKLNKKVVIGVETQDLIRMGQGENRSTFFEEGWVYMENALEKAKEVFRTRPSFEGFAIHCYSSYRLLQREKIVPIRERGETYTFFASKRPDDKEMVIDGDLSDWNETPTARPLKSDDFFLVYGENAWEGPSDFSVKRSSIMWDKEALYLAFEVKDQNIVQVDRGKDMWKGDHIELWLDVDLEGDYNEAVNSDDDFQFGLSPGNLAGLAPEVHLWTPPVSDGHLSGVTIGARKTEDGYTIEVKIPARLLFSTQEKRVGVEPIAIGKGLARLPLKEHFSQGMKMGIMIDPSDCDNAAMPQKCLLSTSEDRKWGDPTRFGILELK